MNKRTLICLLLTLLPCVPRSACAQASLSVDGGYIGGKATKRVITFPARTRPLTGSPLVATNGTITDQVVSTRPDGRQQVTAMIAINGGEGGKVTLTDPVTGLSVPVFNTYGFDYSYPPNSRRIHTAFKGNVFIGTAPSFSFDNGGVVADYQVRGLTGKIVSSGPVAATATTLTLPVLTHYGPYFLWLTRAKSVVPYGSVLGFTVFSVFPSTPAGINFPDLPANGAFEPPTNYFGEDLGCRGWVQGAGPFRLNFPDAAKPEGDLPRVTLMLQAEKGIYITGPDGKIADPVRGRPLLVNFPGFHDGPGETAGITRAVSALYPLGVTWVEGANEPGINAGEVKPARDFYNAVKAGNPNMQVMGPSGVNPIGGLEEFLHAGGGDTFDGFAFHAYNAINGDYDMGEKVLTNLDAILTRYGQGGKPRWMTEQGTSMNFGAVVMPYRAVSPLAAQTLVLERHGVPLEHNPYWYTQSAGFWAFPMWLENSDNSFNPQALLLRRYATETWATPFAAAYRFGSAGDTLWYGNRYDGRGLAAGKSVSVFAGKGTQGETLKLRVSGNHVPSSLVTADAWGNTQAARVVGGIITLPPSAGLLRYVRHPSDLTLTPTGLDFGPDLALAPGVTVITPTNQDKAAQLINGGAENGYDTFESSTRVWGSDTQWFKNGGTADGWLQGDTVFPYTMVLDLGVARTVGRLTIKAPSMWQGMSAIVRADVYTSSASGAVHRARFIGRRSRSRRTLWSSFRIN